MKTKIKEKLETIDETMPVFYGLAPSSDNPVLNNKEWNYFVFNQNRLSKSGTSNNDLMVTFNVAIVHENFIDEELINKTIASVSSIPGLRLANEDFEFNYMLKSNTEIVVEMIVLKFKKMLKGLPK